MLATTITVPIWGKLADLRGRKPVLLAGGALLDAGAGDAWRFREAGNNQTIGRSEGLAVASYWAFRTGLFSSEPQTHPLRVDASALKALDPEALARAFQVKADNPLVGLEEANRDVWGPLAERIRARTDLDADAYAIWRDEIAVPEHQISALDDNWWGPVGPTGPA